MGAGASSTAASAARQGQNGWWFSGYAARLGAPQAHAGQALRGQVQRTSNHAYAPVMLQASPTLSVLGTQPGMVPAVEVANKVIQRTKPACIVLFSPPDGSLATQGLSTSSAEPGADFDAWFDASGPAPSLRTFTDLRCRHAEDIALSWEAREAILSGPLAAARVQCRQSDGQVVLWDGEAGVAHDCLTAVAAAQRRSGDVSVLLGDLPLWAQVSHVVQSTTLPQLCRLLHATHTALHSADSSVQPLVAPHLRGPATTPPELHALSALHPLLAAARHVYFAHVLRHAELTSPGPVLAIVPHLHLHGVRAAYSALADAQEAAVASGSLQTSVAALPPRGAGESHALAATQDSAGQLSLANPPTALASLQRSMEVTPRRSAPALEALRKPVGGDPERAILHVLPAPLAEMAVAAVASPPVCTSLQASSTPWLQGVLSGLLDVEAWHRSMALGGGEEGGVSPDAAVAEAVRSVGWVNALISRPAPWGALSSGASVDWGAWWIAQGAPVGGGGAFPPHVPLLAPANGADTPHLAQAYADAQAQMTQWLAGAPAFHEGDPARGGVEPPPEVARAAAGLGGATPLRFVQTMLLQAQAADGQVTGGHAAVGGLYFEGEGR